MESDRLTVTAVVVAVLAVGRLGAVDHKLVGQVGLNARVSQSELQLNGRNSRKCPFFF